MSLSLVAVRDATIERLLADPPLVWKVIAPEEPELYEAARAETMKGGFFSTLMGRRPPAAPGPDVAMADGEGLQTDIDKAWHGIHYLLTGTASEGDYPAGFLMNGGRPVGDVDVGYGPARVLTSNETREVHDFLRLLADDELRRRFDPGDMLAKEIYPEIWDRDRAQQDSLGYLIEYVRILRGFLSQAVEEGSGIVLYLS